MVDCSLGSAYSESFAFQDLIKRIHPSCDLLELAIRCNIMEKLLDYYLTNSYKIYKKEM